MSVLVGILAAAYACLQAGLGVQGTIETRRDVGQRARVALLLIAGDLASACRLSEDREFVGMNRSIGDLEADNLDMAASTWIPRRPGESDFCEVSWYVDKNPATGRFGLWRRRDPTPDPEPLAGGVKEEIVEDIAGFRLEYDDGFEWRDSWGEPTETGASADDWLLGGTTGLPDAVRVTLALAREGGKIDEAPQVFQTVVCVNLARKLSRAASEGLDGGEGLGAAAAPSGARPGALGRGGGDGAAAGEE
jgi:hypothetical protein